jgi:hypothetical protein
VAFVVEDAAILSRELEATTASRLRRALANADANASGHPRGPARRSGGPAASGGGPDDDDDRRQWLAEAEAMAGLPVAAYAEKHKLGAKLAGRVRWGAADSAFELYRGLAEADMGYENEAAWRHGRELEHRQLQSGELTGRSDASSLPAGWRGQGPEAGASNHHTRHQHRFSTVSRA